MSKLSSLNCSHRFSLFFSQVRTNQALSLFDELAGISNPELCDAICSSSYIHQPQFMIHEWCHLELPESCVDEDDNDSVAVKGQSTVETPRCHNDLVVEPPKKENSAEVKSVHSVTLVIKSFNIPEEEVTYDLCLTSEKSLHDLSGGNSVISYHGNISEARRALPRERYSSESSSPSFTFLVASLDLPEKPFAFLLSNCLGR